MATWTPRKRAPRSSQRKPTEAMKAMIEGKKRDDILLGDIKEHLVKKNQAEKGDRPQDIIHPSEMSHEKWCMRQTAYRLAETKPSDPPKEFFNQILAIFAEGHSIHNWLQDTLGDMGLLWGKWHCEPCDEVHTKVGSECPICSYTMKYLEVPLAWPTKDIRLSGHADGAVLRDKAIVELKTIGLGTIRIEEPKLVREFTDKQGVVDFDGLWKSIKRPFKAHRIQTTIYLAIAKELGLDFDKVVFIYMNKATQAMKEFVITYDEELAEELLAKARLVTKAAATDPEIIPRVQVTDPKGNLIEDRERKPCTECVFKTHCWRNEPSDDETGSTERDAPPRRGKPRGEEETRDAEDQPGRSSGRRLPRSAQGTDRPSRRRTHGTSVGDDGVDELHGRSTRSSRDRREVRRSGSGTSEGREDAGRRQREDSRGDEGEGLRRPRLQRSPRPRS